MSSQVETSETSIQQRITGQVKWFNNKAGYGFITVNTGEHSGNDIFIQYSAINVTKSQYKYLIQGEYVEFDLVKSTSETHEYQAVNVSGINGGNLICEIRAINELNMKSNSHQKYIVKRDDTRQLSSNGGQEERRRYLSNRQQYTNNNDNGDYVRVYRGKSSKRV